MIIFMKNTFVIIFLIGFSFVSFGKSIKSEKIVLGAANWCPYTCPTMANKGFVTEFISNILKENGIELEVQFFPWKRAISMAKRGEISGLLTAAHREAPELKFTRYPSTSYRSCFYSNEKNHKQIKDKKEFLNKKIGVISGYSYGDKIDNFLEKIGKNLVTVHGEDGQRILQGLLKSKRIDYFVEDEKVSSFKLGNSLKPVFCGEESPVFLAVNDKRSINLKVLDILNKELHKKKAKLIVMQWLSMLE